MGVSLSPTICPIPLPPQLEPPLIGGAACQLSKEGVSRGLEIRGGSLTLWEALLVSLSISLPKQSCPHTQVCDSKALRPLLARHPSSYCLKTVCGTCSFCLLRLPCKSAGNVLCPVPCALWLTVTDFSKPLYTHPLNIKSIYWRSLR